MDEQLNSELKNLHEYALDCFQEASEGWASLREAALNDLKFFNGEQWSGAYLRQARLKKAPAVTENRLPVFVSQAENALRQQEISITAGALDEAASPDTANTFTGIIRRIEMDSRAKSQYIHAAGKNGALVPGFGFMKVVLQRTGSDRRQPLIKALRDPFKVLCDPNWVEPDASDATYWFEFEDYSEKAFRKLFPRSRYTSSREFDAIGASSPDWLPEGCIRVARFWYKEERTKVTYLLEDGTVVEDFINERKDTELWRFDEEGLRLVSSLTDQELPVLRNREVVECVIKWCDLTGAEILDEGDWPGDMFPYVLVPGNLAIIDGKKTLSGMIRHAKDSQVMLNYINVTMAKRLSSAIKSPILASVRSIQGEAIQKLWDASANGAELGYLLYNDIDDKGQITPPTRLDQTAQIQDLVIASQAFEDKIKNTIGIYDAGLGATPNEQSGVAIKTLTQQGQNANYHFSDNLVRSLQQLGRILINLIPKVYSGPQVARIINAEGEAELVKLNQVFNENGEERIYNLNEGEYGITINVGPAHANQKQAAIQQMLELARVNPNITPYIQDLLAGAMDFPGKEQVAARLYKLLTLTAPQVVDGEGTTEVPPQVQAQIGQLVAQLQQTTTLVQQLAQENQVLKAAIDTKQVELAGRAQVIATEAEANIALEREKRDTQLTLARVNNDAKLRDHEADRQLKLMQAALDEQRQMMALILQTIKQFGPQADNVLRDVLPDAVSTINSSGAA